MLNAAEALEHWGGADDRKQPDNPPSRSLTALGADPEVASDLDRYMLP